ncbi:MAG: hypothetical protein GX042_04325 [Bacteroidales bacterium]|jgi:hypothetical protein|nr:hypothetical protein [Bacteroidales bacterium]
MENKMNEQESLRIISEMISTARGNIRKGAGKGFLLWGYLIFAASAAHFVMLNYTTIDERKSSILWLGATAIGVIINVIMGIMDHRKPGVVTYIGSISLRIWVGFLVCLIAIMILLRGEAGWYTYPAITFIYTYALYISTALYKIRWMYISVSICVVCLLLYKFIPFSYYPLLMAMVMLVGNILPGHYLNYKGKERSNV